PYLVFKVAVLLWRRPLLGRPPGGVRPDPPLERAEVVDDHRVLAVGVEVAAVEVRLAAPSHVAVGTPHLGDVVDELVEGREVGWVVGHEVLSLSKLLAPGLIELGGGALELLEGVVEGGHRAPPRSAWHTTQGVLPRSVVKNG